MSSNSDRNLLLGILALQMDFINREQLIAATNAWVLDKARPLDAILLEQEALPADTHPLLVALVDKHLEMHGGDAERSLSAVSSLGSVREALNALGDAEVEASISLAAIDRDSVDPYATEVPSVGANSSLSARFRVLRPHAKGGLGEVFVARDDELNREVALKEIQAAHAQNTESRSRFMLEAEVTGGLEHPGIVPVYGLGHYGDGRPYYAMRFIRGDSLGEAIDRFHGNVKSGAPTHDPLSYDSVEFRKLLGRFVDVCNAIQYAHLRGVLHRDLKPGNIMLGKYGETLVVDWGLAKLQGRDEQTKVAGETTLQPRSGNGSTQTQFGSALGTPAYMPPEQSAGQLNELGPESDVYSLGATLYHLLTGQPPVTGSDIGRLLKKVQQGDFPAPRQVKSRVPKMLDAICQRAMAMRPRDRYASPQALADDVERFLADEPVATYVEPLIERVHRWVRKHQTIATTTAAVVLVSAVGLGVVSTIVTGMNRQLATLNRSLKDANRRETEAKLLAQANEESARKQSELAFATLTSVIDEIQGGLENLPGGGEIRRRLLKTSLAKLDQVASKYVEQARVEQQTIGAFVEMGNIVLQFGAEEIEGLASNSKATELSQEQQSAVELAGKFYRRAHEIALKLAADDPSDVQAQHDLSVSYDKLGDVQLQSGQLGKALDSYKKRLEIAETLAANDPGNANRQRNLAISYNSLGHVELTSGRSSEALALYQKSLKIRLKRASDDPGNAQAQRDLSLSYENLGDVQRRLGQSSEALVLYKQRLEIAERLAAGDPSDARAQRDLSAAYNSLGGIQMQLGRSSAAAASHQRSLEIAEKLVAADPTDDWAIHSLLASYSGLGIAQLRLGQSSEALASCRRGLAIAEKLANDDPADARAQRDLFVMYTNLSNMQFKSGQTSEALVLYQKCLKFYEQRVSADPGNAQDQRSLCICYTNLGDVRLKLGQSSEALASYRKGLAIAEKLAAGDPGDTKGQKDLSDSHNRIGDVQLRSGQTSEALVSYQKSLEIDAKLVKDDPGNARAQQDLVDSHYKLGRVKKAMGDYETAAKEYEAGAAVARRMIDQDMNVESTRKSLAAMEKAATSAVQATVALGEWTTLLEQPAETVPALLARRGTEFVKLSRFTEAAEAAEKLRTLPGATARQLYDAAQVFNHCAASIKAKEGLELSAELTKQREQYVAKSVATMKQAFIMGAVQFGRPLSAGADIGQPQ